MNRKSSIIAVALAAASMSSFAIEGEQFVPPEASTLSREEVRAELRELQAAGAWEPIQEASPTPLQAAERDIRIAQLQQQRTALARPSVPSDGTDPLRSESDLMASAEPGAGAVGVEPADAAVSIEAVPSEEMYAPDPQQVFRHPAVRLTDGE